MTVHGIRGTTRVGKLMFVLRQRTLSRCAAGRTGKNGDKFQSVVGIQSWNSKQAFMEYELALYQIVQS